MQHYNFMSHIITELKNLSLTELTGSDYIIVTEVTNSIGQIETKTINLLELTKYNITESNVLNSFRSGSHSGVFIGNFTGSALSSSISTTSSVSNISNYLNYSSNNGTSSYSINSNNAFNSLNSDYALTSLQSLNSTTSSIASYVNVKEVTYKTNTSDFSYNSISSSNSEKTNYLSFNEKDNGIVYHSINSESCSYSNIALSLNPINTTTAYRSITSSYAFSSISSSYCISSSYTDFSIKSLFSKSEAHAYVTFKLYKYLTNRILVDVKEWYNISKVTISPGYNDSIEIVLEFENSLEDEKSAIIKVDNSSRIQYIDEAYQNNTDLYDYTPIFNAEQGDDVAPWDMVVAKSCSRSIAKITLIGQKFAANDEETNAEMFYVNPSTVFDKAYISLIVLNGTVINGGKNYPEQPPTTIPPKC